MSWQSLSAQEVLLAVAQDVATISFKEAAAHLSARDLIKLNFGPYGPAYQAKHCVVWEVQKEFAWFPAKKIFINVAFTNKLRIAFAKLESRGQYQEIKTFDGCLNERLSRGLNLPSLHAWALAIDLNAATNPLGGKVTWSSGFLATMRECGLYCGADWKRKDGMHFALYNG
jgi:hypothetical protein